MGALAIMSTRAVRTYGARKIGLIGTALLSLGIFLSSLTTRSLPGLLITGGIIVGLGSALIFMMVSVVPAQWFRRRRGLATGIVYGFGGLGGGCCALIEGAIIDRLGTSKMYLVFGAMLFVTSFAAAWLIKEHNPPKQRIYIDKLLLRDSRFILVAMGSALAIFPLFVPPYFLAPYAEAELGLSASGAASVVAAFNFSSAFGRLGFGHLCDAIGPLNALLAGLILNAVSLLVIWPVSTSLAPLIVFCVISGTANGSFFSAMPTVVGALFGSERISVAMGMTVQLWSIGYLTGAPLAGFLLDSFGGESAGLSAFRPAMYFSGSITFAAVGVMAFVRFREQSQLWHKI